MVHIVMQVPVFLLNKNGFLLYKNGFLLYKNGFLLYKNGFLLYKNIYITGEPQYSQKRISLIFFLCEIMKSCIILIMKPLE